MEKTASTMTANTLQMTGVTQGVETDEHKDQLDYEILSQEDIHQRQEDLVSRVASVLSLSRPEAVVLLHHFNWNFSKVNEEWFKDEDRVRQTTGLVDETKMTCGICLESHNLERMKSASSCGHFFCDTCWTSYIHTAIEGGPGCLTLRCAHPSCSAAIREDMVLSLVPPQDAAKYTRYRLRAFVENSKTAKWCPAPGCEYAVECEHRAESLSILCKCSHKFCWTCLQEAHRPADCETVAKWVMRFSSESENMNWILLNSKACPKCRRPIEKNDGCIHMTCRAPCRFQFCWLCLGAWSNHNEESGGKYGCDDVALKQAHLDAQNRRKLAQDSLDRYTHFRERWVATESWKRKALEDLQHLQAVTVDKLYGKQCQTKSELEFLTKAWLQIVECLQLLKWTCAHRYYRPDHDQRLEYLQAKAEAFLETLHECAQMEVQQFLDGEETQATFNEYRIKLVKLTSLAHEHFEHLVQYVENGSSPSIMANRGGKILRVMKTLKTDGDNVLRWFREKLRDLS